MEEKKYDQGKPRFDLIDPFFTLQMARVFEYGARKYGENSWQKVSNPRARYCAALHRHINEWQRKQIIDDESGEYHLAHAACNLMFLMWEDIHGSIELSAVDESRASSVYQEAESDNSGSCKVDADEITRLFETLKLEIVDFLDKGGSHVVVRARLTDFCNSWSQQSFSGSDNEA
jgi:hypothetical protein